MAKKEAPLGQVVLKNVRLSFPHLKEKSKSIEDGAEKYRVNLLIDPETPEGKKNVKAIDAAIEAVKTAQWKDKASKIRFKEGRIAYISGDEVLDKEMNIRDGYDGMMVVMANNTKRPTLVTRGREPIEVEDIEEILYAGCYVNACVRFYSIADDKKGGNGMFASIEAVQFWKKGDPFGNAGVDAEDVFDAYDDEDEDDDAWNDDEE